MNIIFIILAVFAFITAIILAIIEVRKFDKKLKNMFDHLDAKNDYDYDSWEF